MENTYNHVRTELHPRYHKSSNEGYLIQMIGTRGFSLNLCVHVLELARHKKWDLILGAGKQDVSIVHEKKLGPVIPGSL